MKTKDLVVGEIYVDKDGRNECVVVGAGVTARQDRYTGQITVSDMDNGRDIVVACSYPYNTFATMDIRTPQSLAMTKAEWLDLQAQQRARQAEKEKRLADRQAKQDALMPAVKEALEAAGVVLYVSNFAGARIDMDFEQLCKLLKIDMG